MGGYARVASRPIYCQNSRYLKDGEIKPIDELKQGYSSFRDGDVLVAKITPSFENGKGALATGLENGIGFGTTELHVLRPSSALNARFLFYLTYSEPFRRIGTGMMQGTAGQKRVPDDFIEQFEVPIPSKPEQYTIAAFLDRETAKIDALIEKKQRLIELLEEKRTALISHAVTKGLDPDAPMKDSGVEWLGEIPEHWEIRRMKLSAELNPSRKELKGISDDLTVSFFPMDAVGFGELLEEEFKEFGEVSSGLTYFREGDVLIAKITPSFENGKGALVEELENGIGFGTTELHVLRPLKGIVRKFLLFVTQGDHFRKMGKGTMYGTAGQKRVPDDFILDFPLALPPLDEQKEIAEVLSSEIVKLQRLVGKISEAIERLEEYRSSMISAAVTGTIDVRDEVKLPS
jgi:type I restriction enzyme S subunit